MTIICGIGNRFRRDDGAGIEAVSMLEKDFLTFRCDSNPENFIDKICAQNPNQVIIIDAADMNQSPGTWRMIQPAEIDNFCLSTHRIPISLFIHLLRECCPTVLLYGIQVKTVKIGEGLSAEVKNGVKNLVNHLLNNYLFK